MKRDCKKFLRKKRLYLLLLLPLGLLLTLAAQNSPAFAEWYATTVYVWISKAGNFISSLVPFSVGEWMVYAMIAALLTSMILFAVHIVRRKEARKKRAAVFFLNLCCMASVLYFLFVVDCGLNYYRYPFAEISGLGVRASSLEELTGLCEELAQQVNDLRSQVREDASGVMTSSFGSQYEQAQASRACYDRLSERFPTLRAGYGPPKPVLWSRGMSLLQITGIFFPFTFEANVNMDVPDYSIPSTMCHELNHLRGYMREDEANFIAYLACMESDSADFRYSGAMLAYIHASNALYSADREAFSQVYALLEEGVKRDMAAHNDYWEQFETPVAQVASSVNSVYLAANGQVDGVQSYGRMVDLLLAEYRQRHGVSY